MTNIQEPKEAITTWLLTNEMEMPTCPCTVCMREYLNRRDRAQLRKVVERMERQQSMNPLLLRSWQWYEFRKEAGLD